MVFRWLTKTKTTDFPSLIYGKIVEQSRHPALYTRYGVPDTLDGRFEMILLHLYLYFERLGTGDPVLTALRQDVFDAFTNDMDSALREIGVGDQSVPKKMKVMAEAFYGRAKAYKSAASDGNTNAFAEAIKRNVFPEDEGRSDQAHMLLHYAEASAEKLMRLDQSQILSGEVAFADAEMAAMDHATG